MESSEVYESTTYAALSPNNHYITGLTPDHLYIYYTSNFTLAASFPLPPSPSSRPDPSQQLHWTPDSLSIILQTSSHITVFSLVNTTSKIKIANGSAGLGRIANVDVVGEYILVIWEFGRVGLIDVSRGRVLEIGELKTGLGGLRNAWGIRRGGSAGKEGKGKPDVLALLGRSNAQDVLTLVVPPETTPFKSFVLETQDAQSVVWSPDGKWLSILDSSLCAPNPAVYVYTSDGNFFRSWPASASETQQDEEEAEEYLVGPTKQSWGKTHLALSNIDATISLLDTRTFSLITLLDPRTAELKTVYTETFSARGTRSWNYSANNETTSSTLETLSASIDFNFNTKGTLIYSRSETCPEMLIIYSIPAKPSPLDSAAYKDQPQQISILHHHSPIRRIIWDPRVSSSLLLTITEDNNIYMFDVEGETGPMQVSNPFAQNNIAVSASSSSSASSGMRNTVTTTTTTGTSTTMLSATAALEPITVSWIPCSTPSSTSPSSSNSTSSFLLLLLLLSTKKRGWCIIYPSGRPTSSTTDQNPTIQFPPNGNVVTERGGGRGAQDAEQDEQEEDDSQDSLFDILHGRTPLPELRVSGLVGGELGYGHGDEMEDGEERLEDTFRGKGTFEY